MSTIVSLEAGSPLKDLVFPGETIAAINNHEITDVLDYTFHSYDNKLTLEIVGTDGNRRNVQLEKGDGRDLGLIFDSYLMDSEKSCRNHCVFCFIDQLPKGMRPTLYYKDDDARLSMLTGNYITMTNLSDNDISRLIALRISPLNVSIHATDPRTRAFLLRNPDGAQGYERLKRLAEGGLELNCQIVCCPGINDGETLSATMADLAVLYPTVRSVSVVPVGLTRYREGLFDIRPFDAESSLETVNRVDDFGEKCLNDFGSRIFYCADDFFLKSGLDIPNEDYYEDYPQLENGIGMLRLLDEEFQAALENIDETPRIEPFSIATGIAVAPFIEKLLSDAESQLGKMKRQIYAVRNDFFGQGIDVSGLLTGGDLISTLRGRDLYGRLLISGNMLRAGEDVFLDDLTLSEVESALGVKIIPVNQYDLLDGILEKR